MAVPQKGGHLSIGEKLEGILLAVNGNDERLWGHLSENQVRHILILHCYRQASQLSQRGQAGSSLVHKDGQRGFENRVRELKEWFSFLFGGHAKNVHLTQQQGLVGILPDQRLPFDLESPFSRQGTYDIRVKALDISVLDVLVGDIVLVQGHDDWLRLILSRRGHRKCPPQRQADHESYQAAGRSFFHLAHLSGSGSQPHSSAQFEQARYLP